MPTIYANQFQPATDFLSDLWPEGLPANHRLLVWALDGDYKHSYWPMDIGNVRPLLEHNTAMMNVFYGIGISDVLMWFRKDRRVPKNDIKLLPAVWLDIDAKDGVTKDAIVEWVNANLFPPSIIVDSGNGIHTYWLLDRPHKPAEVPVEAFTRYVKSVAPFKVDSVFDASRVLRLPGSWNWKDHDNPKPVLVVHRDTSLRYRPNEFPVMDAPKHVERPQLDLPIPESGGPYGGRNETLFRWACQMRHFGWPDAAVETAMKAVNAEHVAPPVDEKALQTILASSRKYRQERNQQRELDNTWSKYHGGI